jgi:hypothetical protein
MSRLLSKYLNILAIHPYKTKVATGIVVFSLGDSICQLGEQLNWVAIKASLPPPLGGDDNGTKEGGGSFSRAVIIPDHFEFDPQRTLSIAAFAIAGNTFMHFWWQVLEVRANKIFDPVSSRFKNAAFKMVVDQALGAPVYNGLFFAIQGVINERNRVLADPSLPIINPLKTAVNEVVEHLPTQMAMHYEVWPFFHLANFYYAPIHLRVVYQNFGSLFWSAVLSWVNQRNIAEAASNARGDEEEAVVIAVEAVSKAK